jgi:hypothetical protein
MSDLTRRHILEEGLLVSAGVLLLHEDASASPLASHDFSVKPEIPKDSDPWLPPQVLSRARIRPTDLRRLFPPAYNQAGGPVCVAHACVGEIEGWRKGRNKAFIGGSRMFAWLNGLIKDGTPNQYIGCSTRGCLQGLAEYGLCKETLLQYHPELYDKKPPKKCYDQAIKDPRLGFGRVPHRIVNLDACFISKQPVICSLAIYPSFLSAATASTGIVSMPDPNETQLGGHCVVLCGHDISNKRVIFRNSFGVNWGDHGYGYLPEEYLTDQGTLSFDWWSLFVSQEF